MNRNDIIDLLTLAAVYDQRTSSESDVRGWHAVATLEKWTAPAAQRVVIEHYSRGADRPRITPAAITDAIRTARHKAAASFVVPDVPEHITGREYPTWYRSQLNAHINQIMDAWAIGEPINELPVQRQSTAAIDMRNCPDELQEQFRKDMSKAGHPDEMNTRS